MKLHQKLFWLLVFLLPVQFGRHLWPDWAYVLGLRIDYLAPTIYLTDILVVGILSLWGIEKLKVKGAKLKIVVQNSKFLIFPIAVFGFLLVNSFLAENQGAAIYKFIKIVEFSLLGFYVAKNVFIPKESREAGISQYPSILMFFSLAIIYSSLIAIAQFLKQASLGGVFWWLGERTFNVGTPGIAKAVIDGQLIIRPYATFPHPNVLAGFLLVAMILLTSNFKSTNQLINQFKNNWLIGIYWILVFILALTGLVLSFSRSAWLVGVLVILGLLTTHFLKKDRKRILLLVSCYLLVAVIFATLLSIKLPFSTDEALFQRLQLTKVASLMIQTSPLIGVGLNNFIPQLATGQFSQLNYPSQTYWLQPVHNIYLLVAAETGLVGLVIFLWFLFLTFKRLLEIRNWKLVIPLLTILLTGVADHYWLTLQQTQLLFTIVLGLSWAKH